MIKNKVKAILSFGLLGNVLGVAQSILLARLLGPELRGELAVPLTFVILFFPLATLGLKQGVAYFETKENTDAGSAQLKLYLTFNFLTSLLFGVIYTVIYSISLEVLFVWLLLFIRCAADLLSYKLLVLRKTPLLSKYIFLRGVLEFSTVLVLFLLDEKNIVLILAGYVFASFVQFCFVGNATWRDIKSNSSKLKRLNVLALLKLSIGYAIPLFLININLSFDVLMLAKLSSTYQVGLYQVAVSIANLLWILPTLLGGIIFSESLHSGFNTLLEKLVTFLKVLFVFSPLVLLSTVFTPFLFKVVFGAEFQDSSDLFNVLILGYYFMLSYKVANGVFAARGLVKIPSLIFLICSVINIICNYFLIPDFNALGAAIATLISYLVCSFCFITYTFVLKYRNDKKVLV